VGAGRGEPSLTLPADLRYNAGSFPQRERFLLPIQRMDCSSSGPTYVLSPRHETKAMARGILVGEKKTVWPRLTSPTKMPTALLRPSQYCQFFLILLLRSSAKSELNTNLSCWRHADGHFSTRCNKRSLSGCTRGREATQKLHVPHHELAIRFATGPDFPVLCFHAKGIDDLGKCTSYVAVGLLPRCNNMETAERALALP
jgi:hypothetical protein